MGKEPNSKSQVSKKQSNMKLKKDVKSAEENRRGNGFAV
jgi:hypothetical protein